MPLREGRVGMYVCGMTPSAQAHLGHARSFIFFDVLRRYLKHLGYDVTYVQNVTDIDDRSIREGNASGRFYHDIIDEHYGEFKAAMRKLGVQEFDEEPYATQFIPQIQSMILDLVENGHAYETPDGIYYRVSTFPNYGKLANRNIDELESGARIEVDEQKEDPLDFALWKFEKPGEPSWPFEGFKAGRPGWHIECSAMSRTLLDPDGNGFDIHGGGADLIFPHHENEIAQSEPLMGHPPMANVWVHGGLLLFDNKKMSKSLGNFEPLSQVLERYDPQAIRLLFLQTGYRKVMNFTEESVAAATTVLRQLKKTYRTLRKGERSGGDDAVLRAVEQALSDDVNTAVALAAVLADKTASLAAFSDAVSLLGIEPNEAWMEEPAAELPAEFVSKLRSVLERVDPDIIAKIELASPRELLTDVLALRTEARAQKDWAASDRIRDALLEAGVLVKDSKEGTTWTVAGA